MKKKQIREKTAPIQEKKLASVEGSSGYITTGGEDGPPDPNGNT